MNEMDKLEEQYRALDGRLTAAENRMHDIQNEFTNLIDLITEWDSWSHNIHLEDAGEVIALQTKTATLLRILRERYG